LTGSTIFIAKATIPGANKLKGVRAGVYERAEQCFAFYPPGAAGIAYADSPQASSSSASATPILSLCVRLAFKSEQHAMQFQTTLSQWRFNFQSVDIELQEELEVVESVEQLRRVFYSHYKPSDYDSPVQSLAELKSPSSVASPPSELTLTDPLTEFQSIERPELFRLTKAYKMHLHDKAKGGGANDNNLLAGSWHLHQYFDGLNTRVNMPLLAIRAQDHNEGEEQELRGRKRRKVGVGIEFYSTDAATAITPNLKEGSTAVSGTEWSSFVWVTDEKAFKRNLKRKYDATKKAWADYDDT
jgi:hypothetical protein